MSLINHSVTALDIFYSFKELKCLEASGLKNRVAPHFFSFPTAILFNTWSASKHNFNWHDMQKSLKINRAMLSTYLNFT